jgi:hypothetical protein
MSVILIMMPFSGRSQNTDCPPDAQLRKILADARQKPILEERIGYLNDDINILNQRIVEKEGIIRDLKSKDSTSSDIIRTYEREIGTMKEQRKILEDQAKDFCKAAEAREEKEILDGGRWSGRGWHHGLSVYRKIIIHL